MQEDKLMSSQVFIERAKSLGKRGRRAPWRGGGT